MTDPVQVYVAPNASVVVTIDPVGAMTPGSVRGVLEAGTPVAIALSTGSAVTVWSGYVDSYGSRGGDLYLVKTDGSRLRRTVKIDTDSTSGADATTARVSSHGEGTHADITGVSSWIAADVSGAGTTQLVRLRLTAAANGSSWSAYFAPDFLKAA